MCLQPITKKIADKYSPVRYTKIPCGKCLECLRDKQNQWLVRLYCESLYHHNVLFFTLTYSPDSVPELVDTDAVVYRTVYKKHVQDWLKRFRVRYQRAKGKKIEFKYFITSEYGPKTKRPHYHGLVFGITEQDFQRYALSEWISQYGFVDCKEVPLSLNKMQRDKDISNVMRYVSKYCMKGEFENPFVEQKKVFPTFRLISKGIGKQFIEDYKNFVLHNETTKAIDYTQSGIESIVDRSKVTIGKFHYSFPKYFKNIVYGEQTLLSHKVGAFLLNRDDDLYSNKLRQIQTDWNCSEIEAFNRMALQESSTAELEEKKLRQQFAQIYYKSKI